MGSKGNRKRKEEKPGHGVTRQNSSLRLILWRVLGVNHTSEFALTPVSASHWLKTSWGQGGDHKPQAFWVLSLTDKVSPVAQSPTCGESHRCRRRL